MGLDNRVLSICKACAMDNIHDAEVAFQEAKKQLKLPELPEWIAALVDNAIREQIHYARHLSNRHLRKINGVYGGPGKVGASSALDAVAHDVWQESVFNHSINGWLLGDIAKEELMAMADIENEKARGSLFNAELCTRLASMCANKKGATVRECLTESQVKKVFKAVADTLGKTNRQIA